MTKKIGIFTSARSEYGVAKLLYEALSTDSFFEPQLLVGGGHFDKEQGNTVDEILKDGLTIAAKFDFLSKEKGAFGISMSNAKLQEQFAQYLNDNPLDLIFLVGDRTELLPVAGAALIQNVAIAHISGGEVTEGAIDNQIRHAVTKMAHVHFVATQLYYNNV